MNAPLTKRAYQFLMTSDVAILKQHYPDGGSYACKPYFPGWSDSKIQKKAWENGIKCNKSRLELIAMRKAREKQILLQAVRFITGNAKSYEDRALAESIKLLVSEKS